MTEIALVPALLEHAPTYFLAFEKLGTVRMEDWMIVVRKNQEFFFFFDINKIWIIGLLIEVLFGIIKVWIKMD